RNPKQNQVVSITFCVGIWDLFRISDFVLRIWRRWLLLPFATNQADRVMEIQNLHAREILDSRGNPTIEVEVVLADGATGRAGVAGGASPGAQGAVDRRAGARGRFLGGGVSRAVGTVNETIAPRLLGVDAREQAAIDRLLLELDGTPNKGKLGANALLGV